MRVVVFGPSLNAVEAENGGIDAIGFPLTSCFVEALPAEITVPVVIGVVGLEGESPEMERYLVALSPEGERVSTMQFNWRWDDDPDVWVKYRAFVQYLPIWVDTPGVYTLGLYPGVDADPETAEAAYPLPVFEQGDASLGSRDL